MNQSVMRTHPRDESGDYPSNFHFFWNTILENRWLIIGIALVTALLGTLYALQIKPVYEANILIQVKENSTPAKDLPGNLPAALDIKTQTATEVEILRSRSVLLHAVEASKLDIFVEPKYFPIVGAWIATSNKNSSTPGVFGYGGYVWGADQLAVTELNLPDALLGQPFLITVESQDGFRLTQEELGIQIEGKVNAIARARTAYGDIEILVSRIAAKPGAEFSVSRIAKYQAVENLQRALNISERGKQSNIIGVSLKGSDPALISNILNEIGTEYIRQNVVQKSVETEKALAFFKQQLADAKNNLERSESRFTELRARKGTFDVKDDARTLSQRSVALLAKLAELKQKRDELQIRFLDEHPSVVQVNGQIQELTRELGAIKAKTNTLPAIEQQMLDVTRDRQLNTEMYTGLLSMGRQLGMVEPSRNANVRLLDRAEMPRQAVNLKRSTMIAVACLAGVLFGVIAAFAKRALAGRLHDPREIEQSLGLMVSAVIPHSENQKLIDKKLRRNSRELLILPQEASSDGAIESLRILRSTLQFSMRDSERNIIMLTGPTPDVGKSFVSANFAAVQAAVGKKVLLIDADMRTGHLHRYFGLERSQGLSDVLAMMANIDSVIKKSVVENLDFISTGSFPDKPAELLAHPNFGKLLRTLSASYDCILIDTAPVLAFSDALIVGLHADAIINVVRDGVSSMVEAEEAVKRLNRAGLAVTGIILNDVKPNVSPYGYASSYRAATLSLGYKNSDAERLRLIRG
ncbi:polysaccharide biosynthesis tyrosine autokinase [Noviherbaspirillum sedimenti]|uniref:Putative tyrosine-protein kinase EpsB n=1 Tax=Noviherbaspirillum sedimenti TaxID=2320865 RepID=A0A3A3FYP6_9BURK|nr:polysaccharide biosynthesis tyrosine autokinase [Noviherbaspirillum sedimenti]RJG01293.1 polysaccharide biosynthesis tyrosine autokinase [Noviherbaspirillum sedimenti]